MSADVFRFLLGVMEVFPNWLWLWLYNSVKIPEAVEICTLNGWIILYVFCLRPLKITSGLGYWIILQEAAARTHILKNTKVIMGIAFPYSAPSCPVFTCVIHLSPLDPTYADEADTHKEKMAFQEHTTKRQNKHSVSCFLLASQCPVRHGREAGVTLGVSQIDHPNLFTSLMSRSHLLSLCCFPYLENGDNNALHLKSHLPSSLGFFM